MFVRIKLQFKAMLGNNGTEHIRHQCMKTTVLSFHRCLINTGVEKKLTFKYRLEL
jgi:hypothetical protein